MSSNKIIYYLATKKMVADTLKELYKKEGYIFKPLDPTEGLPEDLAYLMLIEPLNINRDYYAVNQIWKNYLYKYAPNTKLIIATYAQSHHVNIFSLINFPKELQKFLEAVKPVADYPFVYAGAKEKLGEKHDSYMDSWLILLPHSGRPAITEMQHFLDGHDRARSFSAQLYRMRTYLREWFSCSTEERKDREIELGKEFSYLLQRWYFYEKLFAYMPFADTMQDISKDLLSIKKQIDEQKASDINAQEKLAHIYQLTQDVINPIVFPLDYW